MASNLLPDSYDQREQAFIKHTLLRSYLEKLFLILGTGIRRNPIEICYVDCFAGPWGDDSEGMEATSIAISLKTLAACQQTLRLRGVEAKMRALFIEKDPNAFRRLHAYLENSTPDGVESRCSQGDFVELRTSILDWVGSDSFAFFFVDPKGWKDVGIDVLRPLLARPHSEVLVNFMYNFVNRTMSNAALQKEMAQLIGEQIDLTGMTSEERELAILSTYRRNLKKCVVRQSDKFPPRSAYARILHRTNDRTWYHLVYVTSHPKGIVEFMTISDTMDEVQKQVRATTKEARREERTGMADLFPEAISVDVQAGRASESDVDRYWLTYLNGGVCRIGLHEFASILEETDWFPRDLQASLGRLIKAGLVRNLDATGYRPTHPLHYKEGERLEAGDVQRKLLVLLRVIFLPSARLLKIPAFAMVCGHGHACCRLRPRAQAPARASAQDGGRPRRR